MIDAPSHDPAPHPTERGCLVIADVSGYTDYLHRSELDHAHDILADLTETVVRHLRPTLHLSKLEGDAVFAYALETEIEASMLLDSIDETYFAFHSRVRDIDQATSCDCNACLLIPELNLKFVVHHGRFVRRQVAGGEELTGTDIILAHRLLKNSVADRLQLQGYAFFTQPCIEALRIEPSALGFQEHREDYKDVGEVSGWVEDLEARWRFEDQRRRLFVVPSEAQAEAVHEYPAPPPVVWEYLTSPQKRLLWQDVSRIDEDTRGGRRGTGTTAHCVHGSGAIVQEIVDWRPFHYFTIRQAFPMLGPGLWTFELRPLEDDRTQVRTRLQSLEGLGRRVAWLLMRRRFFAILQGGHERLVALLEETADSEVRTAQTAR